MNESDDFVLSYESYGPLRQDRLAFAADLIWEVIPKDPSQAMTKARVFEYAVEHYMANRQRYLEANDVLTRTPTQDSWLQPSWLNANWRDIRFVLWATGKRFPAGIRYKGIYGSTSFKTAKKIHEGDAARVRRQGDRLTHRAIEANGSNRRLNLPGIEVKILQLGDGGTVS